MRFYAEGLWWHGIARVAAGLPAIRPQPNMIGNRRPPSLRAVSKDSLSDALNSANPDGSRASSA
ncbi:hypothetical protein [Micromonospora globispora]|uniref:hypothetical protein n=1 Tax=Micromonospora globispora TaxID=1450148 RepID=UPI000F508D6D|nr:hypothetical protein [Micromonospora globispora]